MAVRGIRHCSEVPPVPQPQATGRFPTSFAGSGKGHLLCWNVAQEQCQPTSWPCLQAPLSVGVHFPCCLWGKVDCLLYLLPAAASVQLWSLFVLPPNTWVWPQTKQAEDIKEERYKSTPHFNMQFFQLIWFGIFIVTPGKIWNHLEWSYLILAM